MAAVAAALRPLAWAVQERLLWRVADLVPRLIEVVKWPFERLAWLFERHLIWPLQSRTAGRVPPARVLGAGALAAVAAGAVVLTAVSVTGEDRGELRVATPARATAVAEPASTPVEPTGPVLRGSPPSFDVGDAVGVAASPAAESPDSPVSSPDVTASSEGGATASSRKAVSAGPQAMKVARRFADAFVFYEVGEDEERAREIFSETATPQLAAALAERPPRQPSSVEVPQARVLNLVPGPRNGRTYTVSASLLRIGTTSELRLEMKKKNGTWVITDVRG